MSAPPADRTSDARHRWPRLLAILAASLTVLVAAVCVMIVGISRDVRGLRSELATRADRPPMVAEARQREVRRLALATKPAPVMRPTPLTQPDAALSPSSSALAPPSVPAAAGAPWAGVKGRDPSEISLERWLREIRRASSQPGPSPPTEVRRLLEDMRPHLDALAEALPVDTSSEMPVLLASASDFETLRELERARVLLLAAACAESLEAPPDPQRVQRLLDAAWSLTIGLPPRLTDGGPGELLLAVLRQARLDDARAWSDRLSSSGAHRRLAFALEHDAESSLARAEGNAERRRRTGPAWLPPPIRRGFGSVESGHDLVQAAGVARAEVALARELRSLDECADPWTLAKPRTMRGLGMPWWPGRGHVRLTTGLAVASRAQADVELTRHVVLRRHGLEPLGSRCDGAALLERRVGDSRFVVGWRTLGAEPGAARRPMPGGDVAFGRTWPEPAITGAPLEPFTFDAPARLPVLASAPAR